MLRGMYRIQDKVFALRGYDFGTNVALYLSCPNSKDKKFLDSGIRIETDEEQVSYPARWDDLYLSISNGSISASCYVEESGGKKFKNQLNRDVLSRIGSIISGMRMACNDNNRKDLFEVMSGQFNPQKMLRYCIKDKGEIDLEMRTIINLHYKSEVDSLDLEEDNIVDEQIFKITPTQQKFPLDLSMFCPKKIDDSWDADMLGDRLFTLQEIIEKNPDKSYVWLKGRKYHIISDQEEMRKICKQIWRHNGLVAFDTETTGLNVNITSRQGIGDVLVGMVFSIKPGEAWYFPMRHKKVKNLCEESEISSILEIFFKPILENKDIVCHNGAYDWMVMYIDGIFINLVHDTYILFKLTLWNDHRNMELGLKSLTKQFLGRDSFELSDFVPGKWDSDLFKFWDLDEESTKYYACPDTDNLIELLEYAENAGLLDKYNARKVYQIEVAFSLVKAYQEFHGHCVDMSRIDALVSDIKKDKEESYSEMVKIVGHDFNPRSTKDLPRVLYEELGLPVLDKTETGNPKTDKDVRKRFMQMEVQGKPKYPIINHLHRYLTAAQLESNFTKNIDKFATEDGLMFSEVKQFLETGRVSVKNPNYQSYSDVVKHYIVPRTGYYMMDADYSSVEARIMVSMAGCKKMVEALKDPDTDYHTTKASDMFDVPYELVSKQLRQMSKGVNFGILYGLGDPNLGENLYGKKCPENTMKAKKQKERYFKGMEELREFIAVSKEIGVSELYSETYFNRRRYFDRRKQRIDTIERQACNARIQGTAADLYKIAMVKLLHEIRKNGLLGKILISCFIHDECLLEVSKSIDPAKMLKMLRSCMMLSIEGWCPLFIGCGYGNNWYEAKKTELPVQVQDFIIDTYGETGLPIWDGDMNKLYDWQVATINDYKRDRVIDYVKNQDNWNKVFKPVENSLAYDVLGEVLAGKHVDGVVDRNVEIKKDMIENLKQFCRCFGLLELFVDANIQKPVHEAPKEEPVSLLSQEIDEDELSELDMINMRVNTMGVYALHTPKENSIYFRYDEKDTALLRMVYKIVNSEDGDVDVVAVKGGELYETGIKTSRRVYRKLCETYLSRKNMLRSVRGVSGG